MKNFIKLLIILSLLLPIVVKAESVQTGKFNYMPAFAEKTEETYYYSDDYFKQSGTVDNEHLLAMSFNLAISTFEVRNYTYSKALLEDIGFEDITAIDMEEKPTLDTIGTVMAHKEVDGHNLIAVAIRGEKYDSEWGNNFIVGKEGDAKGFSDTSAKVIERLKKYIADNNLDNVKIWMAGYSRAGTVADLTGVYINKNLAEFKTTADDLYIYTFETPAASQDKTVYDNIYVVINKNDIIPKVYPESWGFHTNGKIINIGDEQKLTTYTGLFGAEEYGEESTDVFLDDFLTWLPSRLSREEYAETFEEPISKILDLYFSKNAEERAALLEFLTNDVKTAVVDQAGVAILDIFERKSDSIYSNIADKVIAAIESVEDSENAKALTAEELQMIKDSIEPIIKVLGPIVADDYYYYDGIEYDSFYAKYHPAFAMDENEYAYEAGKELGYSRGYGDAECDDPEDDTVPDWVFQPDDTPKYIENYTKGYQETYHDGYALGASHQNNPEGKGYYEGHKRGSDNGYYDGSNGNSNSPNPADSYNDPYWIGSETECDYDVDENCEPEKIYTEEDYAYLEVYKNAFYEGYNDGYAEGYPQGQADGPNHEMEMSTYHLMTVIKNVSLIMENHHPQKTLTFIQALDSYYAPYDLTEGADQTIDIGDENEDNLTAKTSGHLEKLVKVQVDHIDLSEKYYNAVNGSTIVTLKDSFLKTLSEGVHTLTLVYIDNTIETQFTITGQPATPVEEETAEEPSPATPAEESNVPKTGDNIELSFVALILSMIGIVGINIYLKEEC